MGLLDGKVAIITGSGGGIGRAHALLFASEGAKLVINDLGGARDGAGGSSSMADQVVAEIKKAGGQAVANYASVATMEGARSIVQSAIDAFGRADILVNNAGILRDKTFLKMEEGMWDLVIAVHLKGTYLCSQVFGEHVRVRAEKGDKGGRIINTSSYAGLMGNYGQTNYAAAKAGIYGLTKVWALELAKLGITVNCIAPMAKTRMTEDISAIPDNMKAEHIAPMVLYLASDLAKDVNGRIFGIHGQQLLEYKMLMNEGVTKAGEEPWSAREIHEKLDQIGNFGQGAGSGSAGQPSLAQATGGGAPKPMGPEQIIDQAFGLLPKVFVAERAKGWKATIHFDIAGASPWTVTVDEAGCRTEKGKAGSPTCVVNVDKDTYAAVVSGQTKPEKAFMEGKIKATNLGDMMKFGSAFDMKKARELAQAAQTAPQAGAAPAAAAPATAEQIIDQAFGLLPKVFVAERAKGWKATIHFDIAGASPWTVSVDDAGCRTEKGKAGSPTCVVNVDKDTYAAVVSGQTKPEKAFMEGKIKATNLGDMMKFGSAFDMKKARELAQHSSTGAAPQAGAAPAAAAPATAEQIIDQAFTLMPKVFVAERAKGWKATIHFDIAGASPWTVIVDDAGCRTEKGKTGSPTCVVNVDKDTYAAVVSGQTKPEKAFMEGKIKATNLGDMMKFGSAFDMKKARELAMAAGVGPGAPQAGAIGTRVESAPAGPEATVARAFELLPQAFKADRAAGWTAAIVFEVAGAGDWTVAIKDGACTVTKGKAASPTCVVSVSVGDYAKIVSGELKAEQAFMSKKLTATNLGDMMKFGGAFDMKKAAELLKSAAPAAAAPPAAPASGKKGMNRGAIGKRFQAGEPAFVRPEHAVAYAKSTQDSNPWYLEAGRKGGVVAPPMFAVRLLKDIMFKTVGDPELGADLLLLVHGEQDMEFFRPLRPWDLVAARSVITGIEEKSTGEVVHFEETLYASGELAVRVKASIFVRDPGKKRDKGAAEPEAAAEGHKSLAFEEKITVAPDQSLRYADASLDNNPIHTDDGVAKMAGFPGVINQGLCTMAFAQKTVVNAIAGGDPTKLKRLAVRFSKPVLMNDNLTVEGWDTGRKDGRSTFGFRVINQKGEEVIKNGVAELAL